MVLDSPYDWMFQDWQENDRQLDDGLAPCWRCGSHELHYDRVAQVSDSPDGLVLESDPMVVIRCGECGAWGCPGDDHESPREKWNRRSGQ